MAGTNSKWPLYRGVCQEKADCMIRRPLMQVKSNKESHAVNDNYRTF